MLKHLLLALQYAKPPPAPAQAAPSQQPNNASPMLIPNAKSLAAKQLPPPVPVPAPPAPAPPTAAALAAQQRRKRLMGDITLSAEDEQWVRRLMSSCLDEWRATGAGSVKELFTREEHWVSLFSVGVLMSYSNTTGCRLIGRIQCVRRLRNEVSMKRSTQRRHARTERI
jgi:hypothetical protein